jgi:hypothetical protein
MPHLSHPIITSNVDAILKHQAKFVTSSTDIILENDKRRTILLSLFTTGGIVSLGPGGTTTENFGVGDDLEVNFTTTVIRVPVIPNTVIIKIDGVQIGIDNGSGTLVGNPTPGDIIGGSSIDYSTGALDVTFNNPPALNAIVSVTYAGFITDKYVTITAPAATTKWDLSAFLKNAPYCLSQESTGFIVSPDPGAETVIAYVQIKGD